MWTGPPPAGWTDPRVVAALAADCDFVPPAPERDPAQSGQPADLFRCTFPYEQSCVVSPCANIDEGCKDTCSETCRGCGATCAGTCSTCKAGCKDDACRTACAMKCAECKQECTRTLDRCASGACAKAADACHARRRAASRRCKAKCDGYARCQIDCMMHPKKNQPPDCFDQCAVVLDTMVEPCLARCGTDAGREACAADCYLEGCTSTLCKLGGDP